MATDCIAQVTFQGDGFAKPVVARFDRPNASTDGGLVLFKALDTALGLTQRLAACLEDAREPGKVQHETSISGGSPFRPSPRCAGGGGGILFQDAVTNRLSNHWI